LGKNLSFIHGDTHAACGIIGKGKIAWIPAFAGMTAGMFLG